MAAITQTCWGPKHYDQSMETHTGVQQLNTNERTEKFQKPVLETMFLQSNPFQVLLGQVRSDEMYNLSKGSWVSSQFGLPGKPPERSTQISNLWRNLVGTSCI